jgi:hypothetical protein
MSDALLVATIVVFFTLAALLVDACGRIVSGSVDDAEPDEPASEHESRST